MKERKELKITLYFFGLELLLMEDQGISSLAGESVIWKCPADIGYSSLEFRKEVRAKHNVCGSRQHMDDI